MQLLAEPRAPGPAVETVRGAARTGRPLALPLPLCRPVSSCCPAGVRLSRAAAPGCLPLLPSGCGVCPRLLFRGVPLASPPAEEQQPAGRTTRFMRGAPALSAVSSARAGAQRLPEGEPPQRLGLLQSGSCVVAVFARWETPANCPSCYLSFLEGLSSPACFLLL